LGVEINKYIVNNKSIKTF